MLTELWRRWTGQVDLPIWYDASYWLPLPSLNAKRALEPRRADFVTWYLIEQNIIPKTSVHTPTPISYQDIARVHTSEYIEGLLRPDGLAKIFAVEPYGLMVDELFRSLRMACGGTLEAARHALTTKHAALNLLGGFHHAGPNFGGGFCALNDIVIAVSALRAEGFSGQVVVIDVDAHPPDGLARCIEKDPFIFVGSLSGSDWGPLVRVDETVLPKGCGDDEYLFALERLLKRIPTPSLAFVIAGGDVLAGDTLGQLGLSLEGARKRDATIAEALKGVGTVWLPGGGYHEDSWRLLTNTALVLTGKTRHHIPREYRPIAEHFSSVAQTLQFQQKEEDGDWLGLRAEDLEGGLQHKPAAVLLGFYNREGIEHALVRYGLWERLERLGYQSLRVALDSVDLGGRVRVFGTARAKEHLLVECIVSLQPVGGREAIFVHWLNLRHPLAAKEKRSQHPLLPGQDVPGLGLSREVGELFRQMSKRLGTAGVALCPAWYHVAFSAHQDFNFTTPERQARFEALTRDLNHLPIHMRSARLAEGKVLLNGEPYQWEATDMASWIEFTEEERDALAKTKASSHFSLKE